MTADMKSSHNRTVHWIAACLLLLAFGALLFHSLWDRSMLTSYFVGASYYLITAIVIVWAFYTIQFLRAIQFSLSRLITDHQAGLIIAGAMTVLVFSSVEPGFRVLSDETNLVAISQSMLSDKKALNATIGIWRDGNFWPSHYEVPKRPLLYPFGVHLLHVMLGYSHRNAFYFNGMLLFLMLAMAYVIGRKAYDWKAGIALMLLLLAQPIITLSATSAGFDFFSTFFYALVVLSLFRYMRQPTPEGFALLWVNLIMFANIRYESFIYLPIIVLFLLLFRVLKVSHWTANPALYASTPLLFLPRIWQMLLKQGSYENPEGVPLFGVQHFLAHLAELAVGFLDVRFHLPYATLLNLLSLGIFLVLASGILIGKFRFSEQFHAQFALIVLVMLGTNLVIVLSHHGGHYMHPTQARGFLVLSVALSVTPLLLKSFSRVPSSTVLLSVALLAFVVYHPVAIEGRFTNTLTLIRENRIIHDFLKAQDTKRFLLVYERSGIYTALAYGAVDINYANRHADELLLQLRQRVFEDIYVVQKIRTNGQHEIVPENRLEPPFVLETLNQIRNEPNVLIRISRVRLPDQPEPLS